tara:strand:- start:1555 stop:3345 length:1791 start_codon:yes stop_codon:yes gene_type:complete
MEQNKLDSSQIIGFLFLIAAFISLLMFQPQIEEPIENTEIEYQPNVSSQQPEPIDNGFISENTNIEVLENEFIILENEDVIFTFSTKGAQISKSILKKHNDLDGNFQEIINDNQNFYFESSDLKNIDTSKMFFSYNLNESSLGKEINFSHIQPSGETIFFNYFIPNNGYLLKLDVYTSGYNRLFSRNSSINLNWNFDSFKNSKSQDYENRYTYLNYQDSDKKVRDLSAYSDDDDDDSAKWISYSQHFFTSILIFDDLKNDIEFSSSNIDPDKTERKFLKNFKSKIPITINSRGELDQKFEWYIGPKDYYVIKNYDYQIADSIYFGWGIFGWINRTIFFPLYNFLSNHFSAGIAIIIMVILTRLVMSPVQYKMYLSQAKMKVLKPEITAATEKFKDDPMKRQQETMKIYSQAGASPVQGCLPALLQIPVFYALFCFFPVAFALRGESFLWADDLSTYDVIADLPFYIPLYGDHISLFPILAGITMFFYTRMQGTQQMQPSQPGMPNMKIIMYIIPFSLLIFFNNFASGLSLYYTVSNILTIIIMLTIKNVILDDKKILLEIEENKKKPKTEGRFQRRLRKLQEAAEKAQQQQNRKNK